MEQVNSETSDTSQPHADVHFPVAPPFHYNRVVFYTHPRWGFVLETEGWGRSGGARTAIHVMQFKSIFTQGKVDAFRDKCAAFGWVPEHITRLLDGDDIERSVGYLVMKGMILSGHYKWSAGKMKKWMDRHLFPYALEGRYNEYQGLLKYDINIDTLTIFDTPSGDHIINIRTLRHKPDGSPDLRKEFSKPSPAVFMKCPQRFDGALLALNAFCYNTTISSRVQTLKGVEAVRSWLIRQDEAKGKAGFGFEECEQGDPDLRTLKTQKYKKSYPAVNDSTFEHIHLGHTRAQENKILKDNKAAKTANTKQSASFTSGPSTSKRPRILMGSDEEIEQE